MGLLQHAVFLGLSLIILLSAVMVIVSRNPVASAIFLIVKLFALAGIYAQIGADFLAVIQIIVYAGAIMVLFMFVIMLLNLTKESYPAKSIVDYFVGFLGVVGFILFAMVIAFGSTFVGTDFALKINEAWGNTQQLAHVLFVKYLWPFELASLLILLAIVASVVIAKKPDEESTPEKGVNR